MTSELELLTQENQTLRHQLDVCRKWMRREVDQAVHSIAKRKVTKMTEMDREGFLRENQEAIISKRIQDYFGDMLLLNAPREMMEHLINAEINFYNLGKNPSLDGFSVVSSYHKIFDILTEQLIVHQFRKYAQKKGAPILRVNDPMEKALYAVITKKHILSLGRLYGLLQSIRTGEKLHDFGTLFSDYLSKYPSLRELLVSDAFFDLFKKVILSEIFGSKRHQGSINMEDTKNARKWIAGDFADKDSLLYRILESQAVMY